jgi:hypothetical protein
MESDLGAFVVFVLWSVGVFLVGLWFRVIVTARPIHKEDDQ